MNGLDTVAGRPCRRCQSPLEAGDLRCAICSLPTEREATQRTATVAEVLRCDECGAAITYDVRVQAPRCAFCGSVMHLERSEDPIEEAQAYLPFRVDPATAQQALRTWLGSRGFFRPSDLATASQVAALRPLWWVGWVFDCESLVSWTADSDHGRRRSAWAPHSGQALLTLSNVLVSASRGLSAAEAARLASAFDLRTAQAAPHAFEGAVIERFDVQRSAARGIVAAAVQSSAAAHAQRWIPGTTYRNLRVSVLLRRLTTRRVALPSYVLAYRYREKLYRVVLHGQDPRLILGDSPISLAKVALVALGVLGVLALLFALAVALGVATSR
jgi:hypothetical protein